MDNKFYVKIPFSIKEQAKSLNAKLTTIKRVGMSTQNPIQNYLS